jgi:hypothetical protein
MSELTRSIHDSELLSPAETARLFGQYANKGDFRYGPFDESCTIFASNAPGGIAAKLVTECLSTPSSTVELFGTVRGDLSKRGLGVPLMNRERSDGSFGYFRDVPESIRVPGESNYLGWYDKDLAENSCRPTGWSLARADILEVSRDFERNVHRVYHEELPHHWREQYDFMRAVSPDFKYLNSVYSTMTINRDARFPYHYDMGDFAGGLGNLVILEGGDDEAGVIVMPEIRCAFLVRPGDVLFMDVHQLHGNLPLTPGVPRLTAVLYARQNINKCK